MRSRKSIISGRRLNWMPVIHPDGMTSFPIRSRYKKVYIGGLLFFISGILILLLGFFYHKESNTGVLNHQNMETGQISVLSANMGNLSLGCLDVLNKLCYQEVEQKITENIAKLSPDIVALQEVLAPWLCEDAEKTNPKKVCSSSQDPPQVRRILGENYSIICNSRNQFECIAVRTQVGRIQGCEPGAICNDARTNPEIAECDNGFTVSAATVQMNNGLVFDLANVHPQSTNQGCRKLMLSALFGDDRTPGLLEQEKVLIMGDFNLDPWRDRDVSADYWRQVMKAGWMDRPFRYHCGISERANPYYTTKLLWKRKTVDFIVSNFAEGSCQVLGESPGTQRLDGGQGTDHRAIFGYLHLSP